MKKVLLIGEIYSENLGDGVICEVVEHLFNIKEFQIVLLDMCCREMYCWTEISNNFELKKKIFQYIKSKVKEIASLFGIKIQGKKLSIELINYAYSLEEKIKQICPDAIIFVGGQLFMSCFIDRIESVIKIAKEKKIPVFFNACGCGNIIGKKDRICLENILKDDIVKYISVRDGFDKLLKMNIKNKIVDTYDTAIMASMVFERNIQTEIIGLGVMFLKNYSVSKQVIFWKRIIWYCKNNNLNWCVFTNGSKEDEEFATYLLNKYGELNEKRKCNRPQSPEELVKMISSFKIIISMRLHSLIVAYSMKIPAVAISWDEKVNSFYKKIGRSKYCFDMNSDEKVVMKAIIEIMNEKEDEELRKYIQNEIYENIYYIQEQLLLKNEDIIND